MSTVTCPYCDREEIEVESDCLEEGVHHEQECPGCGKLFVYETYVEITCTGYQADCLNGAEHKLKKTGSTSPVINGNRNWHCTDCGKTVWIKSECNINCSLEDLKTCWHCEKAL